MGHLLIGRAELHDDLSKEIPICALRGPVAEQRMRNLDISRIFAISPVCFHWRERMCVSIVVWVRVDVATPRRFPPGQEDICFIYCPSTIR
jgi:hypothetical protein